MPERARNRLLVVLAAVAVFCALHFARPVLLPVAFALFLIGLLWPVMTWFRRWLPRTLAFVATLLTLTAGLWAFGWVMTTTSRAAVECWPQYQPRFEELSTRWSKRAQSWGLSVGDGGSSGSASEEGSSSSRGSGGAAHRAAGSFVAFVEGALLTIAFTVLGLLEVEAYGRKLSTIHSSA